MDADGAPTEEQSLAGCIPLQVLAVRGLQGSQRYRALSDSWLGDVGVTAFWGEGKEGRGLVASK